MTVEVLYFAVLRDLVGLSRELVETETGTLAELLALLCKKHPPLVGRLESVRVAQNEAFASLDAPLSHGDVIALIPPVAGG